MDTARQLTGTPRLALRSSARMSLAPRLMAAQTIAAVSPGLGMPKRKLPSFALSASSFTSPQRSPDQGGTTPQGFLALRSSIIATRAYLFAGGPGAVRTASERATLRRQ